MLMLTPPSPVTVQLWHTMTATPSLHAAPFISKRVRTHTHTHTESDSRTRGRRHTGRDVRIGRSRGSPAFHFCLAWRIIIFYREEMSSRRFTLAEGRRGSSCRGQSCFSVSLELALPLSFSLVIASPFCATNCLYCSLRVHWPPGQREETAGSRGGKVFHLLVDVLKRKGRSE